MDTVTHLGIFVAEEHSNAPERVGDVLPMEESCLENHGLPVFVERAAEVSLFCVLRGSFARTTGATYVSRAMRTFGPCPEVTQWMSCEFGG